MPAVTRYGDADVTHCSPMTRHGKSIDVFANGLGISRQDDVNTDHDYPPVVCLSHAQPITTGSTSVFVNGKGCGRVGDAITSCTSVAAGSADVFAGP